MSRTDIWVAILSKLEAVPCINVPAGVLSIVVSNLVRNACQFTVQVKITILLKRDRVEISDTGSGIGKEEVEDITR